MTKPSFNEESTLWSTNIDYVIGIDEVGRGAFAGPIVAAGVVFHPSINVNILSNVNDSKLVKPRLRESLSQIIKNNALFWTVQSVEIDYINKFGIGKANSAVFRKVIKDLLLKFESEKQYHILIDGFHKKYLPGGLGHQEGIVRGDTKSYSIAAASILAKVYRDKIMKKEGKRFPNYLFGKNKGYGSKDHREAILKWGETEIHRSAYVASWISKLQPQSLS